MSRLTMSALAISRVWAYSATAWGIPPTQRYSQYRAITGLSSAPNGFRFSKHSRTNSGVTLSPIAQQNSSKSIGFIVTRSSSEGIRIPSMLVLSVMSEPVSM